MSKKVMELEAALSLAPQQAGKLDIQKLKADLTRAQNELEVAKRSASSPAEALQLQIRFHSAEIARHNSELVRLQAELHKMG
jgi:cob(I)alamin adenosyltransferase